MLVLQEQFHTEFCNAIKKYAIMGKRTYYPTMFHTNPFTFNRIEFWETSGDDAKELLLINSKVKEIGVSKMKLNVIEFSVFDNNGNEYFQQNIARSLEFSSKGIDTEFFTRINNTLKLKKGTYESFRFYLASTGNQFIYDDWRKEDIYHLEFLDFDISQGLRVESNGEVQVKMRFDFKTFSLKNYFRSLSSAFNRPKRQTGKLVNC